MYCIQASNAIVSIPENTESDNKEAMLEYIREMTFVQKPFGFQLNETSDRQYISVSGVKQGSQAFRRGVKIGWIVLSLNGKTGTDEIYETLFDGKGPFQIIFDMSQETTHIKPTKGGPNSTSLKKRTSDSESRASSHASTNSLSTSTTRGGDSEDTARLPSDIVSAFLRKQGLHVYS